MSASASCVAYRENRHPPAPASPPHPNRAYHAVTLKKPKLICPYRDSGPQYCTYIGSRLVVSRLAAPASDCPFPNTASSARDRKSRSSKSSRPWSCWECLEVVCCPTATASCLSPDRSRASIRSDCRNLPRRREAGDLLQPAAPSLSSSPFRYQPPLCSSARCRLSRLTKPDERRA